MVFGAKIFSIAFFIILLFNILIGGFAIHYLIEVVLPIILGYPVMISVWPCFIAGLFLGDIAVPLALIVWIGLLII
jgi:hypothetical protein